jgi:hypothetical protein
VHESLAAIAHHYLDRPEVQLRVAKIAREHGPVIAEASAEVAAEVAMEHSDHWARHLKRKSRVGRGINREVR